MATMIPDGALKLLHEDFVRLSRQLGATPCVVNWVKHGETFSNELREFVAMHYDVRFRGFPDEIEQFEKQRRKILDTGYRPSGTLEMLPGGDALIWWSPSVINKNLQLLNRFSARALELLGDHYPQQQLDAKWAARIRWMYLARHIVHSDDWFEPHEEVVLDSVSEEQFKKLTEVWKDYPERQLKDESWYGDMVVRLNSDHWQDDLLRYLCYKTLATARAWKKAVPRILADHLGNAASYSAKAIELYVRQEQRSLADAKAREMKHGGAIGQPEEDLRRAEVERLLGQLPRGKTKERLGKASTELLKHPGQEWTLEELAGLAECDCHSGFRSQMQKAKLVGFFDPKNEHYIVSTLGLEGCQVLAEKERASPGQGRG